MCINITAACPAQAIKEITPGERLERSKRRSKKLSAARFKNLSYHRQTEGVTEALKKGDETTLHLDTYRKRLITCASHSLYRRLNNGRECTLIATHACNHRLCNVCNMLRSRKLRRKWRNFLDNKEQNVPIRRAQAHFFEIDPSTYEREGRTYEKDIYFTSGAEILQRFDLMHLTLTVPHEGGKWNGKEYYAQELLKKFNLLRKCTWWTEAIFGGEYTIETTSNDEGLHIHIHALLFVDKGITGSRNYLYTKITQRWNELTVDRHSNKAKMLDIERIEGIKRSFAFLEQNDLNNLLLDLDGRGSTMTGLKSLYYQIKPGALKKHGSKRVFEQDGKHYVYSTSSNIDSVLRGVTECLKYHFEPCALEDENGDLDTGLLLKVLPNIYRQRLYGKFGGFYAVKQLNVMEEPLTETDMLEEAAELAKEAFNPRTGKEISDQEYHYVIADACNVRFDQAKPLAYISRAKVKKIISPQEAPDLQTAVKYLLNLALKEPKIWTDRY